MPRILELVPLPDGRLGVVLDVPATGNDPDSVSLWTAEERDRAIASAVAVERVAILELVEAARKVAAKAPSQMTVNVTNYAAGCVDTCDTLAAAIRARGKN
jgi:hypothetical protein